MIKKLLSCIGILLFSILLAGGFVAWQSYHFWFQSPTKDAETVLYTVEAGAGFSSIADDLAEQHIINSKNWFKFYTIINGTASDLKAGVFELKPGMSYSDIMKTLMVAPNSEEVSITFPEGYTVKQMGELVAEKFNITPEEWSVMTGVNSPLNNHNFVLTAQKPAGVDLEGYLFPDTYRFFVEATAEDIVEVMLDTMENRLVDTGAFNSDFKFQSEISNLHELLTTASILEREVRTSQDIPQVADIIYKRLKIGMPLQMDSTVNYFTGNNTPSISLADRDIESPYNTYLNTGLPPGPISNPGIDSLKAAVSPKTNDYYYFLTDAKGEVFYGVAFDQHITNKNKYLK